MKVLRVAVPCKSINISSLFWIYSRSLGKVSTTLPKSSVFFDCFDFFKRVQSKSRTCCKMLESTMFYCLKSVVEDLSAETSIGFDG